MGSQIVTTSEKNRRDAPFTGLRAEARSVGLEMAKDYPDEMRGLLSPHVKRFCDSIASDLTDRTNKRLFAEIMGAVGAKNDLVQALVIAVGANSPEHLKSAASAALDAEAVDEETAYAQALEFVHDYRRRMGMPALVEGS